MSTGNNLQSNEIVNNQKKEIIDEKLNHVTQAFVIKMLKFTNYDTEAIRVIQESKESVYFVNIQVKLSEIDICTILLKVFAKQQNQEINLVTEQEIGVNAANIDDCIACLMSVNIIRLVKDLIILQIKEVNDSIRKVAGHNQTIVSLFIKLDYEYIKNNFGSFEMEKDNLSRFFYFLNPQQDDDLQVFCGTKENFEALTKSLSYEILPKVINNDTIQYFDVIYNKIKTKSMKYKFAIYENIKTSDTRKKEAVSILKKLTDSTLETMFTRLYDIVKEDPFSVMNLLIKEATKFDAIIPTYKKLIRKCHPFFVELLYFRTIYNLVNYTDIANNYGYTKGYINIVEFIDVFFSIDIQPIALFITKNILNKVYIHVPLLEKLLRYSKNNGINTKILRESYVNVFNYTKQPIQFKIDIADRYYNIYLDLGLVDTICTDNITYANIRYLLPSQIRTLKDKIRYKVIIDKFLLSEEKDFYTLKNIIILINCNASIQRECLIEKMEDISQCDRDDLKVLSQCCKANLIKRNEQKAIENEKYDNNAVDKINQSTTRYENESKHELLKSQYGHIGYDKRKIVSNDFRRQNQQETMHTPQNLPEHRNRDSFDLRNPNVNNDKRIAKYARLNEHLKKKAKTEKNETSKLGN